MLPPHTQPMFNIFCRDIDRQFDFYQSMLGWTEIKEASSPIYRVLTGAGIQLAMNGWKAYDLLSLADRKPTESANVPVSTMLSLVVQAPDVVNSVFMRLTELGGRLVKGPFATYYGHWQIVFCDPENNIVRVTSTTLPAGVQPSVLTFD